MSENLKVTRYIDGSKIFNLTETNQGNGFLYDWFAIHHKVSLCPSGWHVPSYIEWNSLISSMGQYNAGSKLEEDFTWKSTISQWWSSTEQDSLHAQSLYLNNQTIGVMVSGMPKTSMLSVRCIRDN
jgi:hypothetical protein